MLAWWISISFMAKGFFYQASKKAGELRHVATVQRYQQIFSKAKPNSLLANLAIATITLVYTIVGGWLFGLAALISLIKLHYTVYVFQRGGF